MKRPRLRILLWLGLAAATALAFVWPLFAPLGNARMLAQVFASSAENYGIVAAPDHVSISRVGTANGEELPKSIDNLTEFKDLSPPIELNSADTAMIARLLSAGSSYWNIQKACSPKMGVAFRFQRGRGKVTVLLCLRCGILAVYHGDKWIGGGVVFDSIKTELRGLAQRMFPNDSSLPPP
jgi:hypothetical protein